MEDKTTTIDDLAKMINEGFKTTATKEDIKAVTTRLDGIDVRLDTLDGRVDTLDARLGRIEADVHALTRSLAGRFTPTAELNRAARLADELNQQIVARAQAAHVLREDIEPDDFTYVLEQIASLGQVQAIPRCLPQVERCLHARPTIQP